MEKMKERLPQAVVALILVVIVVAAFLSAGKLVGSASSQASVNRTSAQNNWETHDPSASYGFQFDYVGAASNTVSLMQSLPVGEYLRTTEIQGTDVVFTLDSAGEDQTLLRENMTYSAIGFMSLIGNASGVTFATPSGNYTITRSGVEDVLGTSLLDPLTHSGWEKMRSKIPALTQALLPE